MARLVVLTDEGDFFGQTRKPWVSLNIGVLCRHLQHEGIEVARFTFEDVGRGAVDIRDSTVFYAFSQKENTRRYITDIVWHLAHGSNLLIPSYDLLMCHENKGYQELFRRQRGLPSLPSAYLVGSKSVAVHDATFPVVVKTIDGSNGRGVFLAHDTAELGRIAKRIEPRLSSLMQLDLLRRRFLRRKKVHAEYPDYDNATDHRQYRDYVTPRRRFIVQEFIRGMVFDFRVLILGNRHFVTKRHTLEGDFRASGTKLFDFNFDLPDGLLDFSRSVYDLVDTPFLSMDICPRGGGFVLFEFQALHFGINVLKKANGWFLRDGGSWRFEEGWADFERCMAEALVQYLRTRGIPSG